jgi:cytosine/adenosine deaminase-related metal-dependent hydrolase
MLWVTRHAFQHQREMDNRSLREAGKWPADQHATHTRDALYWATMGGAKALRLDGRIGSLTPGKQADLAMIDVRGMNIFPALPGGDPAHVVVMYAETADIENVMVAGRFLKREGKLAFPPKVLEKLNAELLESRLRLMKEGGYVYNRAPNGPLPERYVF